MGIESHQVSDGLVVVQGVTVGGFVPNLGGHLLTVDGSGFCCH